MPELSGPDFRCPRLALCVSDELPTVAQKAHLTLRV